MTDAKDLNPYQTSDTPLAAYLHLRGIILLTTKPDPTDRKRQIYIFVDEDTIPTLEDEFYDGFGEFKDYFNSLKTVQRMLYKGFNGKR